LTSKDIKRLFKEKSEKGEYFYIYGGYNLYCDKKTKKIVAHQNSNTRVGLIGADNLKDICDNVSISEDHPSKVEVWFLTTELAQRFRDTHKPTGEMKLLTYTPTMYIYGII
jgi:hypothetical protein